MLEKVDLTLEVSKAEYKRRIPPLEQRLLALQTACWKARIPTIVVFEGWDAAGKGTTINALTQPLEPRGFKLHATRAPRTYETHMPWLWRFWRRLPNYGEMAIFDRSWYGRVLVERVQRLTPKKAWQKAYQDIVDFEFTLANDGHIFLKFFFHISKKEQARRFRKLERDPLTRWQVQPEDWEHHRNYKAYAAAVEEMLQRTDTEWSRWTIVEATDRRWAQIKVFETLAAAWTQALQDRGCPLPPGDPHAPGSGADR